MQVIVNSSVRYERLSVYNLADEKNVSSGCLKSIEKTYDRISRKCWRIKTCRGSILCVMSSNCIFCRKVDLIHQGELTFISQDKYPASPGHLLIVPNRHVPNYFDCTQQEIVELWETVHLAKAIVEEKHQPDSYNIGINVSKAAGQSVPHTHIHLIPRYEGDVPDPRGGIRSVIPKNRTYTKTAK